MKLLLGILPGTTSNGETYSDIMAINHYGSELIPPRPVLRIGAERTIPANKKRIQAFLRNLVANPKDAKRLETVLLTSLGQQCAAEAKRVIDDSGILQENAPSTIAQKGYNKPLYVDGNLKNHISYEVET